MRAHAFLHKATATSTAVTGWFEAGPPDSLIGGPVSGRAEVEIASFDFGDGLLASTAERWIDGGSGSVIVFELGAASGQPGRATIAGRLTIGDAVEAIETVAAVTCHSDEVVISGTWTLSQRRFRLPSPPGVKDRVDIEFRLVARPA